MDSFGGGRLLITAASAIETMGAELAFGQSDGLHEGVESGKFQAGDAESSCYLVDHALVFGCACCHVAVEVFCVVAFEVAYDAAGDELEVVFGIGEPDEGAAVDERRAGDTGVDFSGSVVEEHLDVVVKLCAANDAVVADDDALSFEDGTVGDELHLGDKVAAHLAARCEGAWPCGGVFQHSALVGYMVAFGIADGHADA